MTTTVVRDSIVGDAWIQQTAAAVPIQRVVDAATGQLTGDILTGPVRIAFDNLFTLPQATAQNQNPKYGAMLLFTPYADFSILYEEYYAECAVSFREYYDAQSQSYNGLHSPFRDQREKTKFGGFTPGCIFINCTSKFKPPVIDVRGNPIVDPSKVYPGVWAICSINRYPYGKNPPQPKKGVGFGLQSVMIIGDDTKFGGGAPDPTKTFAGVNVSAPIVRPDAIAHMPGAAQQPAPVNPMAGGYGAHQPAARPAGAPVASVYTPPVHNPAMPATVHNPAAIPPTGDDEDMSFLN